MSTPASYTTISSSSASLEKFDFPAKHSPISQLPPELTTHILTYLSLPSLLAASQVSKQWHTCSNADLVWKGLYRKYIQHNSKILRSTVSRPLKKLTLRGRMMNKSRSHNVMAGLIDDGENNQFESDYKSEYRWCAQPLTFSSLPSSAFTSYPQSNGLHHVTYWDTKISAEENLIIGASNDSVVIWSRGGDCDGSQNSEFKFSTAISRIERLNGRGKSRESSYQIGYENGVVAVPDDGVVKLYDLSSVSHPIYTTACNPRTKDLHSSLHDTTIPSLVYSASTNTIIYSTSRSSSNARFSYVDSASSHSAIHLIDTRSPPSPSNMRTIQTLGQVLTILPSQNALSDPYLSLSGRFKCIHHLDLRTLKTLGTTWTGLDVTYDMVNVEDQVITIGRGRRGREVSIWDCNAPDATSEDKDERRKIHDATQKGETSWKRVGVIRTGSQNISTLTNSPGDHRVVVGRYDGVVEFWNQDCTRSIRTMDLKSTNSDFHSHPTTPPDSMSSQPSIFRIAAARSTLAVGTDEGLYVTSLNSLPSQENDREADVGEGTVEAERDREDARLPGLNWMMRGVSYLGLF
ncbi:hypothetical protein BKA69DRAFT_1037706 [Paraphysoderma sedebokerense]|nr:hypothetical protein BKA69DRAFT_1037706 [Paraphysoderma sedebokerense]